MLNFLKCGSEGAPAKLRSTFSAKLFLEGPI